MSSGYQINGAILKPKDRFSDFAFGQLFVFGALGILSAFLFVVTQSMLSGGEVKANNIGQWFVGFLPMVTIFVWSIAHAERQVNFSRAGIIGWIFALLVFISVHELHRANELQTVFYNVLGYENPKSVEFVISVLYAACGAAAFLVSLKFAMSSEQRKSADQKRDGRSIQYWIESFFLIGVLFVCFVYRLIF